MRHVLLFLFVIYFLLVPPGYSTAQSDLPADCKPADLLATLPSLKSTGDPVKDLAALQKLNAQLDIAIAKCAGLHFSARGPKAIGPLLLESGIYRATVTTKGFFAARITVLQGDCDDFLLFNLSDGDANDGAENIIMAKGCTVIITTSNISDTWTLTLEKIR